MYTNVIPKKTPIWIRIFNFIFNYRDPEDQAKENYRNRIFDRYKTR